MCGLEEPSSIVDARWAKRPADTAALAIVRKPDDSPEHVRGNWPASLSFEGADGVSGGRERVKVGRARSSK